MTSRFRRRTPSSAGPGSRRGRPAIAGDSLNAGIDGGCPRWSGRVDAPTTPAASARRVARRGRRSTNGTFLNGDAVHVHGFGARDRNANPSSARGDGDVHSARRARGEPGVAGFARARDGARARNEHHREYHREHREFHEYRVRAVSVTAVVARLDPGKPPRMEDRWLSGALPPARVRVRAQLFAVFDGHAGCGRRRGARRVFPEVLAKRLRHCAPRSDGNTPGDAANALRDAFLETDANIRCEYEGCSAAVLLVWRCASATGGVYAQTANVGDAGIVLGRTRGQTTDPSSDARVGRVHPEAHLMTRARTCWRTPPARAAPSPWARRRGRYARAEVCASRVRWASTSHFSSASSRVLVATPYVSAPIFRGDGNDVAVLATRGLWRVADAREAARGGDGVGGHSVRRGGRRRRARRAWCRAGAPAQVQGGRRGGGRAAGAGGGHRNERGVSNAGVRRSRLRRARTVYL